MNYKTFDILENREVSVVGFGCWATGGTWNNTEDTKSIEAIRYAIENGVNFFDVAPVYGKGHAEKVLGEAIQGYDRSKLIIATKCGLTWKPGERTKKDLTKESLFQEIEESLERLQTDYIDLYQCHWPDPNTPIEETMEALLELKKLGKIREIGLSNYSVEELRRAEKVGKISSYQGLYNMLERDPETYHHINLAYRTSSEILPICREQNIPYLPYSPLMQGLLTGTFKESNNFDENDDRAKNPKLNGDGFDRYYKATEELKIVAKKIGKPLAQLAINWLVDQREVGPIICGAQTVEHVKENIAAASWNLDEATKSEIEDILTKYDL